LRTPPNVQEPEFSPRTAFEARQAIPHGLCPPNVSEATWSHLWSKTQLSQLLHTPLSQDCYASGLQSGDGLLLSEAGECDSTFSKK